MLMKSARARAAGQGRVSQGAGSEARVTPNQTSAERGRKHTARSAMDMENVNMAQPTAAMTAAADLRAGRQSLFFSNGSALPRLSLVRYCRRCWAPVPYILILHRVVTEAAP